MSYDGPDGIKRPLAVSGQPALKYVTAGQEMFKGRSMICEEESKRVNGRYLKNVIINGDHVVTITQEQYIEVQGKIAAMTSPMTLTCPTS